MKKLYTIALALFVLPMVVFSQIKNERVVTIADETGKVVETPFVAILSKDSMVIKDYVGVKGRVTLVDPNQSGILYVSCFGYGDKYVTFEKFNEIPAIIEIELRSLELKDIVVKGNNKTASFGADGKISLIIGKNSPLKNLSSSLEVMTMVPGLRINGEDISIMGRGSSLVVLDGVELKSTEQIRMITPDRIKSIIVDRNPKGNYTNYGAVVYVTTNRTDSREISASVSGSANFGRNISTSAGGSAILNIGKFSNYVGYGYTYSNTKYNSLTNVYNYLPNYTQRLNSNSDYNGNYRTNTLNVNSNYKINNKSSLDLQYYMFIPKIDVFDYKEHYTEFRDDLTFKSLNSNRTSYDNRQTHVLSALYTVKFDNNRKLVVNFDYAHNSNNSLSDITTTEEQANDTYYRKNPIDGKKDMEVVKIEYSSPLTKNGDISFVAGGKFSNILSVENSSVYDKDNFIENNSKYKETISSLYYTLDYSKDKFYANINIRGEYWHKNSEDNSELTKDGLFDFVPTLGIGYDFNPNFNLSLNYRIRTYRPSLSFLSPTVRYINEYLYFQGNPSLKNANNQSVFIDATLWKNLNVSIAYFYSKNEINLIYENDSQNNNVIKRSYINLDKSQYLDIGLMYNKNWRFYTLSASANMTQPFVSIPYLGKTINERRATFDFDVKNFFQVYKTFVINVGFGYKTKGYNVTSISSPSYRINASASVSLCEKSLNLALNGSLINNSWSEDRYANVYRYDSMERGRAYVGLSVSYRFKNYKSNFRKNDNSIKDIERLTQ